MNYVKALNLIATLKIKREQEKKFIELSKTIFPPLANETGWKLTSLRTSNKLTDDIIHIQNQWQTNEDTTERVEKVLSQAMENLAQSIDGYQQQLEMLDELIIEESLHYANSYTI
tara:strand:- start:2166 stop:2510 length:345 start_codon:yes stop_codon:yes gene_type:complete